MPKLTLAIDSQQLTSYQRCPRRFLEEFIRNLEPKAKKKALEKGKIMATALESFYLNKKDNKPFKDCVMAGLGEINNAELHDMKSESAVEQRISLTNTFAQYCGHYRNEKMWPVAAETGFSKVLYEDDKYLILYEGRPDLVVSEDRNSAAFYPVDHKTESMRSDLHGHSNQFLGYAWGLGTDKLLINYVGFQKSMAPEEKFRRDLVRYSKGQLQEWQDFTTRWALRILQDIEQVKIFTDTFDGNVTRAEEFVFLKNRAGCTTKYGFCVFTEVCDAPNSFSAGVERSKLYQIRETPWSAWKPEEKLANDSEVYNQEQSQS